MYLNALKAGNHVAKKGSKTDTKPCSETEEKFDDDIENDEDGIEIIDEIEGVSDTVIDETGKELKIPRAKLIQFHENRRPPYWGTFQKMSTQIRPRNPFRMDIVSAGRHSVGESLALPTIVLFFFFRICLITKWTVMMNGKKKSRERVYMVQMYVIDLL